MKIGNMELRNHAALAPMAGVADSAFRTLCMEYGASFSVGEMVSCKGLCYHDRKSAELLQISEPERPCAIQLFGDDPEIMAKAAAQAYELSHPDWVDINMGCPAPKVAGNHCGSSIMRDPELCYRIVKAVSAAVPVPVTAKMRKGYSAEEVNAVDVAKACEEGGAAFLAVHGRTRDQMYAPPVDRQIIKAVKESVSIPVIGNGDVTSGAEAASMMRDTGCDLVMVGRAALGQPWIFEEINAYFEGKSFTVPTVSEQMAVLIRQAEMAISQKGEKLALLQTRKHAAWYIKGMAGAAELRKKCGEIKTLDDLKALCETVVLRSEEI